MRSLTWFGAVVFLVASLAGCVSRQQMNLVVQAGLDASALGRQATADVRVNLASSQGMEFLAAAMGTGVDPCKIEDLAKRTEQIRGLLLARQVMFAELEKMYRTLKTLADYDAASEIDGAVGGAVSAVLTYANMSRNAGIPAPDSIAKIIDTASKAVISGIQQGKLANANRGLANFIDEIVKQLDKEKASRLAIAELQEVSKQNILIGMLKQRFAWPHILLAKHAADVGLVYDPSNFIKVFEEMRLGSDACAQDLKSKGRDMTSIMQDEDDPSARRVQAFHNMQIMLIRAHLASLDHRLNVEKDVLEESIKALKALARAHRKLEEESERLDLAELTAIVGQLRIIATEAATIAADVRSAKDAARAESNKAREARRHSISQELLKLIANKLGISLPAP